jgi:hypothetical protein
VKKTGVSHLLLAVLLLVTGGLYSQETEGSRWGFGVAAGPQFTNISSPGLPMPPNMGIGFLAGVFAEYALFDNFKVRMEADFDRRSFNVSYQSSYFVFQDSIISRNSYGAYDFDFNVDYLTIPLSFIYMTGGEKFKLFIQGTFYYSVYLSARKKGYTNVYIAESDFQFVDQEKYPDLQPGHNKKEFNESTDIFFNNERFNSYDMGVSFFIGGIYKLSEKVDLYLSPGFTSSFGRILENPVYDSRWIKVFKIETGIVVNLN